MKHCQHPTPLGPMLLIGDDDGLHYLGFEGQKHAHAAPPGAATPEAAVLQSTSAWLDAYFGGRSAPPPRLAVHGTPFQRRVWQALAEIPRGQSISYAELARRLAAPHAVRAVAAAVGRNPISIIVPCHRVLGSNGSLTGYAGGLARKAALLQLEGHPPPQQSGARRAKLL